MAIPIGTVVGSYEITALIGKGGMGEVYRARDSKLKRDVAIKTLPEEFARDADRVSRFVREAEVVASLSHPNIGAVYGLEESGTSRWIVMELVEGETLAEFDLAPDGKHFLSWSADNADERSSPPPIWVVSNWFEDLRRRVAAAQK